MKQEIINIGNNVYCDDCDRNFVDSTESGGILFGGKAICPNCAPTWEKNAAAFGETQFIRARCPEGTSFRDWVLGLRNGNNTLVITSWS